MVIANFARKNRGFTLVELLIVIVIIAILASITVVAYNGIQARAQFSKEQQDLATLHKAILLYYSDNGHYPITSGWKGFDQVKNDNFIPGLVPTYISDTPQMDSSLPSGNTYLYESNSTGDGYILQRYNVDGLPTVEKNSPRHRPADESQAWGYWTANMGANPSD